MKCDYLNCKRDVVSGGNIIIDEEGDNYSVDLCAFHLRKLIPRPISNYLNCCHECGNKRYKVRADRADTPITISEGVCEICKETKPIIPARDWEYFEGKGAWD